MIYRIAVAQVVTRRITKPQRTFLGSNLTGCSFLFTFCIVFFFVFFFFWGGGGGGLILLFSSCLIFFFLFIFLLLLFYLLSLYTCIRYIYKNFCNNTSYSKFGNTRECER